MIFLEQAVKILNDELKTVVRTRLVSLEQAEGRIAAADVYASVDIPPFDRSPLDGYALQSKDVAAASRTQPVKLKVAGEIPAGSVWDKPLKPGSAVRIMTGGMLPLGADCVIRQENTDGGEKEVSVYTSEKRLGNICFKGEDVKKGALIVRRGEVLNYAHLGVLAGVGKDRVLVMDRIRSMLLSTGDELTLPGEPLGRGKIYNSNHFMLAARLKQFRTDVTALYKVGDNVEEVCKIIEREIDGADIVFTTGGVSVGPLDIMPEVFRRLGAKKLFWRVAIKPGMPVFSAIYRNKPVLCLSGNPFAAMTNFELLGRPALYKLSDDKRLISDRTEGVMEDGFYKASPLRRFVRAVYSAGKVRLSGTNHSSGALMALIGCNALIDIPKGSAGLNPGDRVRLVLL